MVLRGQLLKRIETTAAERDKLLTMGKSLGSKIKNLIPIVTPRPLLRWGEAEATSRKEGGFQAK